MRWIVNIALNGVDFMRVYVYNIDKEKWHGAFAATPKADA
jgi:hypothetical protein